MIEYDNLLARPFEFGKTDCFALVRDFYKQNYGIEITNYARPKDWSSDKLDIIGEAFPREGFEKLHDWTLGTLQPGDVLAMAIGASKANHLAVYVGGNTIIHHVVYQMSRDEMLRDFWRKSICFVLRHKNVPATEIHKDDVTIEELLNARYKLQPEEETTQNGQG